MRLQLLSIINVLLTAVSIIAGITTGIIVPSRWLSDIEGFQAGAFCGGLVILLGSFMSGLMVAGQLEELFGTEAGVPIGLLIGCFLGAVLVTLLSGLLGVIIVRIFGQ